MNDKFLEGIQKEDVSAILKKRAILLSNEDEDEKNLSLLLQVVLFSLSHEIYGIELKYIREVYPLKELTYIPCTPPFVLGVINCRGQILSIVDFKRFFDLPEKGLTDLNRIIILHSKDMEFGILADTIHGIGSIPVADIQESLPTLTGIKNDYLKGVTKDRVIILDGAKILADKHIVVHNEV